MPKLFQINTTLNVSATGRIAEQIGILAKLKGWEVWIAHGPRYVYNSVHNTYQVCSPLEEKVHALKTRLYDAYGLGCTGATKKLVLKIKEIDPDIIHLHNIHGYYLDYRVLFNYLKDCGKPVIWTLHDCWPFTGHCFYFDYIGCERWKTGCHNCPSKTDHPRCYLLDNSKRNYKLKARYFTQIPNMVLVPVSNWLEDLVGQSFFNNSLNISIKTIHNGIDIQTFSPKDSLAVALIKQKYQIPSTGIMLIGCAARWLKRKGYDDFLKLRVLLPDNFNMILIGLSLKELKNLPKGIIGIQHTQCVEELATLYSSADIFVNPTHEDNFPTTNLEALACGTPVITYDTGGSPEAIDKKTGVVIPDGDVGELAKAIVSFAELKDNNIRTACRKRAEKYFDKDKCFESYLDLYRQTINII
jgi:glycosyltransferase involved in cell wall biosynthesis